MKLLILTLVLTLLCHCASKRYDDDKSNPDYYDPRTKIVSDNSVRPTDPAKPGMPEVNVGVGLGRADAVVAGVLATGILLTANRDYYRSTAITGKCICGGAVNSNIQLPCTHVTVLISDSNGKELARVEPNNGEFAFRVKKGIAYRLNVESKKYKLPTVPTANTRQYFIGDDVILNLIQK